MIVGLAHLNRCRRLQRALERAGKPREAASLKHVLDQVDDHFRVDIAKPAKAKRQPKPVATPEPVWPFESTPPAPWPFPVSAHQEPS